MKKPIRHLVIWSGASVLLAGCAILEQEANSWTPPTPGTTWQMSQQNTGSYGKDVVAVMARGSDTVWQGEKVMAMTNTTSGMTVMIRPDSKWAAIVTNDGRPVITYTPPIGYEFPLRVGKTWKTHHKAFNHMTGKTLEFDYSCTVEAVEDVVVKAGTFKAFKIVCDNEYSHDESWWSREAGVNVKQQMLRKAGNPSGPGTQRTELVAFNAGR